MASIDGPRTLEHPPHYEDGAIPLDDLKPPSVSQAEPPPPYSIRPDPLERSTKRRWWSWRKRLCLGALIVGLALAGSLAGVFGKKEAEMRKNMIHDPKNPSIIALAAAECDAGTFVLYQLNTSEIYLQGSLSNRNWNNTSVPYFPPMKLGLAANMEPLSGTSLTAVCMSDLNGAIIRIYFYYVSVQKPYDALIEAAITIPTNFTTPLSVTQSPVQQLVSGTSSLAAVYLPSLGIKVYFLTESLYLLNYTMAELTRGWPWRSNGESLPQLGLNETVLPNIAFRNTRVALTAAAVEWTISATLYAEIRISFVDKSSGISTIMWDLYDGWSQVQQILKLEGNAVTKMASIIPTIYNGTTSTRVWFISGDHQMYHIEYPGYSDTRQIPVINKDNIHIQNVPSPYQYPDALIAATCWNVWTNTSFKIDSSTDYYSANEETGERIQLFYLGSKDIYRDRTKYDHDRWVPVANAVQMGRSIWNITGLANWDFTSFPQYSYLTPIIYDEQPDWGL
ncbi:hypothetical protein DL98DRAFT_517032 [Cadophora sp. DSE1049]|nr:hypothetical protein DL98DRAFT_517032 [Cadophora sp. DSE1049]